MDSPLWIDTHAPAVEDFPQGDLRRYLSRAGAGPINLLLYGPPGSGKTAAARALARHVHDDPENDFVEINVADFFDRTKSEIREDPRFSHFLQGQTPYSKRYRRGTDRNNQYKRDWSKRDMITHVLKESASYSPVSGGYRTILLDNAEAMREDFQQALRRVMEDHHEASRFVIATRQPSTLIPAIRSRCFPVPVRSPTNGEVVSVLRGIVEAEGVDYDEDGLAYVAGHADGDLRTAILDAQTVAEAEGAITREAAYETLRDVGMTDRIADMLDAAEAGEFSDARKVLDELLFDEAYTGTEVLESILRVARSRDGVGLGGAAGAGCAVLTKLAGDVDVHLAGGTNDRLHLAHLLAEIGAGAEG